MRRRQLCAHELEGSLNHLTGRLDAVYGGERFTVEATPRRGSGRLRDNTPRNARRSSG